GIHPKDSSISPDIPGIASVVFSNISLNFETIKTQRIPAIRETLAIMIEMMRMVILQNVEGMASRGEAQI
ncbi:MAG: hypothetical protein MUF13_13665, partial [Akkermansiaceae bacterium]|nr:hypothetical protein [Akkermansiaceae bacterium]